LNKMDKAIDYYMGLPYTIEMVPGLKSGWVVSVRELPGCISQGDSPQHAIDMIHEAMCGWLEIALEDGIPVPEPRPPETFSGKFVVRVPRWLHRELVRTTDQEGVSLNQFVSTSLARAVGEHMPRPARPSAPPSATAEISARLDAARPVLAALIACLKRGETGEALLLAAEIGPLLQADLPGAITPEGQQRAATPRRDRSQKSGPKSGLLSSGSRYVISPQTTAVCLADNDAGEPATDPAPHG
jgi:antitoxin HicB